MTQETPRQTNKRSENARAVAHEVIQTIKAGKKVRKGRIIKGHGYSDSVAERPSKVTDTKSYKEVIDPVIQAMIEERDAAIRAMKSKRSKAKYRDLTDAIDKLTKNIELLSGRDTSRIGGLIDEVYGRI